MSDNDHQFNPRVAKRNKDRLEGLARNLGVFGYMGRIPPRFITEVHYDEEQLPRFISDITFEGSYDFNREEFEQSPRWSEEDVKGFQQEVIDLQDELEGEEDEEEEYE